MQPMKFAKFCLLMATAAVLLASCGGTNEVIVVRPMDDLFDEAYDKIERERYSDAATLFLEIENSYPATAAAPEALIMAAYSQYMAHDFAGTIMSVDKFMRFHPGHPDVPYVLYLRGMSFYRQVSDVRRDPGMSGLALQAFEQLRDRLPNSEYAKNAKNKVVILKNYIAGKMMFSARRELKRHNFPTAITNLQNLITAFPETQMVPEAMFRLTEAYAAIGMRDQADGYAEMLSTNFPDNEWTGKLK